MTGRDQGWSVSANIHLLISAYSAFLVENKGKPPRTLSFQAATGKSTPRQNLPTPHTENTAAAAVSYAQTPKSLA